MNFRAICSGLLLDLTLFKKERSSSGLRGPLQVGRPAEPKMLSSVCESSHCVESVSVQSAAEAGVEWVGTGMDGVGVEGSASRAWETVGEVTCIGVLTFLAILRAGEGDLRGMRRGVSSTGLEGGDFFRFVTSEKRREGAGGVPQI